MRILFWSEYFPPYIGGSETFAVNLLHELKSRGHQLVSVSSHAYLGLPDVTTFEDIPSYRFPFREALQAQDLAQIEKLINGLRALKEQYPFDIIHLNSLGPIDFFHHQTNHAKPTPYIITFQQRFPPGLVERDSLPLKTLSGSKWVACCSQAILEEARQLDPELCGKSSLVHSGLRAPGLEPKPLPRAPVKLLCLGRLLEFKGFDVALRAFPKILRAFPDTELTIAGDGSERQALEDLAAKLALHDSVQFKGWVQPEQIPAVLNEATVVLIPSRWEGLPFVGQEAAMMARPIVATNAGGLPELVSDRETGIVIEQEDHEALATAVISLIEHPELAIQYGQQGRKRVLGMFDIKRCATAYEALYQTFAGIRHD